MKFTIWNPDCRDEEDAQEKEVPAFPTGYAKEVLAREAEVFADQNFSHWDYPNEMTVCVRFEGELYQYSVEVCSEPTFLASLKKT
jgi:hypothetical protein